MRKDLLRLFETDAAPRVLPPTPALARVKMEAHRWYNSYTTLFGSPQSREPDEKRRITRATRGHPLT